MERLWIYNYIFDKLKNSEKLLSRFLNTPLHCPSPSPLDIGRLYFGLGFFLIPCSNILENSELKKDKYFLALGLVRNFKMIIYNSPRKMQCFPNILHHGTPFLPHCRTNNCRSPHHPVSNSDIHKPHKIYPGPIRCQGWIWSIS